MYTVGFPEITGNNSRLNGILVEGQQPPSARVKASAPAARVTWKPRRDGQREAAFPAPATSRQVVASWGPCCPTRRRPESEGSGCDFPQIQRTGQREGVLALRPAPVSPPAICRHGHLWSGDCGSAAVVVPRAHDLIHVGVLVHLAISPFWLAITVRRLHDGFCPMRSSPRCGPSSSTGASTPCSAPAPGRSSRNSALS